jgi:hypothetical protein
VSTVTPGQHWSDNPILDIIEARLRGFGGSDLNRTDAAQLLGLFRHAAELTVAERSAVLLRFPVADVPTVPAQVGGHRPRSFGGRA